MLFEIKLLKMILLLKAIYIKTHNRVNMSTDVGLKQNTGRRPLLLSVVYFYQWLLFRAISLLESYS